MRRAKYRLLLLLYLLWWVTVPLAAQDYKEQIGLETQRLTDTPGDAGPVLVYNETTRDYLALYTETDPACPSAFQLMGQIVSGTTGMASGNATAVARGDDACGSHKIWRYAVAHDPVRNQYLLGYVSVNNAGGANVHYALLDGASLQILYRSEALESDLLNPYQQLLCSFNSHADNFTFVYRKIRGSGEGQLVVRFIAADGSPYAGALNLTANEFNGSSLGVHQSDLAYATEARQNYLVYEVDFPDGSEIWCSTLDPQNRSFTGSAYRVSGDAIPGSQYQNPALSYDGTRNRLLVVYENVQNEGLLYSLAGKVFAQPIDCSTNNLLQPANFALSQLPFAPSCITCGEQIKKPVAAYSPIGGEHFIAFYGVRPASQDDTYDLMGQRVTASSFDKITQDSYLIEGSKGTSIAVNKSLKSTGLAHNPNTNQFLLAWYDEARNAVEMQIRRLENNPPLDIVLSGDRIGENAPEGTTVGDVETIDPDPDDAHSYTLADLPGQDDARHFKIEGGVLTTTSPLNFEESPTHTFTIRTVDSKKDEFEKTVQITVEDRNDVPDSVGMSNSTVLENSDATLVGNITVYDQDATDTHTLQLTSQTDKFELQGSSLLTITALNREASPQITVGLQCRDSQGGILNTSIAVEVADVNEAPTGIALDGEGFDENRAPGSQSIDLVAVDEDANDVHTFALVAGAGHDDNASFRIVNGNKLQSTVDLDFEKKASYSIRLRTSDREQLTFEGPVTVSVVDQNERPYDLQLSNQVVEEALPVGTVIGTLSVSDPDGVSDAHIYTMQQGGPDLFVEENGTVRTNTIFTYSAEQPGNNLRTLAVTATDLGGLSTAGTFTVEIIEKQDHQRPFIVDMDNSDRFDDSNPSKMLEITVADDNKVDSVIFYYKGITESQWNTQTFTDLAHQSSSEQSFATLQIQLSKQAMDELGISYRYRVKDPSGNDTLSDLRYIYRLSRDENLYPIHNASFNGTVDTYQMMSVPYDVVSAPVDRWLAAEQNLGAYKPSKWRLFHYSPRQDAYEEFPAFTRLQPGKGYWFNAAERVQVRLDSAVVSAYNEENLCVLNLREGWNQIGNPYPFAVSWDSVLLYNELEQVPLYLFHSGYTKSAVLPAFTGALVYLSESTTITVPFAKSSTGGRTGKTDETQALDAAAWQVDLQLRCGDLRHNIGGFGMHPEALSGGDRFDEVVLPRFIEFAEYRFHQPKHEHGVLSRDVVPSAPSHTWELTTEVSTDTRTAQLAWNNSEFGENPYSLILYDVQLDRHIDMRRSTSYSYEADAPRDFRIFYGMPDWTDEQLARARTTVAPPYPNPFQEDFVLPVHLPHSSKVYSVEINITDVTGAHVCHGAMNGVSPGTEAIRWSDFSAVGGHLQPGMYLYNVVIHNGNNVIRRNGKLIKH